jgi:hypothetical protein
MNWCLNILTLTGSEPSLGNFECENRNEKNNLSLSKSVPLSHFVETRSPSLYEQEDNEFDEEAVKVWGCGWDCFCFELEMKNPIQYVYEFDTPVNPPIGWLEKVSLKYPDIEFDMVSEEYIQDYSFHIKIKNGYRMICESCGYQEKQYKSSNGDQLAKDILDRIKDHKMFDGFIHEAKDLLDLDDPSKKEEIEMILDEYEAYDFLDYLQKRMRELYLCQ